MGVFEIQISSLTRTKWNLEMKYDGLKEKLVLLVIPVFIKLFRMCCGNDFSKLRFLDEFDKTNSIVPNIF